MNIYNITVKDNKGNDYPLANLRGKTLLIVNTATKCGFTPQYKGLEALYEKYQEKGLVVLDFPCNQFLSQAPGSDEEIDRFARINYGTTFPRFQKIEVNGEKASPLYVYLKEQKPGKIKWNFTKFLVNDSGEVVARYESPTKPEQIEGDLAKLLGPGSKTEKPLVKAITGLTLFSLDGCPHCAIVKTYLKKFGIKYEDLSWSKKENDATFDFFHIKAAPVLISPDGKGGWWRLEGEEAIGKWARKQNKKE